MKKTITLILFALMAFGQTAWAQTTFSGGSGTEGDPYQIKTIGDLNALADDVNNNSNSYEGVYFKLMNDLTYDYTGAANENNFTAIGSWDHPFKSCFDGNDMTIRGIRIYKYGTGPQYYGYQGIFGYVANGDTAPLCEVKNLTIDDADITANGFAGGIVGYLYGGTVTNCHATSTVFVRSACIQGIVNSHGGIVGNANASASASEISYCTSAATQTNPSNSGSGYGAIVGEISNGASVHDNFAIGANVCSVESLRYGAIVGDNINSTLARNYYHTAP